MKTNTEMVKEKLKEKGKLIKEKIGSIPIDSTPYVRKLMLLKECKATLKGMQIVIKSELEFLENFIIELDSIPDIANLREDAPNASFFISQGYDKLIHNAKRRITDLRNALKLLEEEK